MPRKKSDIAASKKRGIEHHRSISLKQLAAHVGLSPTTVSFVLNDSPLASTIPQETKDRIFDAARELNYRPNFLARSLRTQRSYTIGVLVPEVSGGYTAGVMNGIEEYLLEKGYFYIVASHRHKPELLDYYPKLFLDRCVEGIIGVDTPIHKPQLLPMVSVSGHEDIKGVTNIVLDHQKAAELAIEYIVRMGHQQLAVIKGQAFSSDTQVRWDTLSNAAKQHNIRINPQLVSSLEGDSPSPEIGYQAAKKLLAAGNPFSAVFAFNDISAIGAISAFREAGFRVPEDISVIGFDDIDSASFHNPPLTTIRQPLRRMGWYAAETLLDRITKGADFHYPEILTVEPKLIIRQSTAAAPANGAMKKIRARGR
ncbi:MAG: LacI family DNA-binding transcriptional regulator [Acidobacteriota bacterium]